MSSSGQGSCISHFALSATHGGLDSSSRIRTSSPSLLINTT
jgi:hypothetical protein